MGNDGERVQILLLGFPSAGAAARRILNITWGSLVSSTVRITSMDQTHASWVRLVSLLKDSSVAIFMLDRCVFYEFTVLVLRDGDS